MLAFKIFLWVGAFVLALPVFAFMVAVGYMIWVA
jgi:hypothetical protein